MFEVNEVDAKIAGPVLQRYAGQVTITAAYFDADADDSAAQFVNEAPRHPGFCLTDVR